MKTIIAGGRQIATDKERIFLVAEAVYACGFREEITEIVSGGCRGIDLAGEQFARDYGIPIKRFSPDWDKFGKAAGPIRNAQMAEYADALVLIWDGYSRGSADMKKKAKEYGLRFYEHIVK